MRCLQVFSFTVVIAAIISTSARAADMPAALPLPAYTPNSQPATLANGFYLRGDLGYRWNMMGSAESVGGPANPSGNHLSNTGSVGTGIGYKSSWFRTDLSVDYLTASKYRGTVATPDDVTAKIQAIPVLLNAYLDLGTWQHVTPYIGVGAGTAYVRLTDYQSAVAPPFTVFSKSQWQFAYAGLAGLTVDVSHNVQIDLGYRYLNLGNVKTAADASGSMTFKNVAGHEVRIGLRWNFNDLYSFR